MLIFVAKYTCKPGIRDELIRIVKDNVENTRKEDGNISYDHFVSYENEDDMYVLERWESYEKFAPHSLTEHHKRFCKLRGPLLVPGSYKLNIYVAEEDVQRTQESMQWISEHAYE